MKGFKILKGFIVCLALMFIIGAMSTSAFADATVADYYQAVLRFVV